MKKKILSLALVVALVFSMAITAKAAPVDTAPVPSENEKAVYVEFTNYAGVTIQYQRIGYPPTMWSTVGTFTNNSGWHLLPLDISSVRAIKGDQIYTFSGLYDTSVTVKDLYVPASFFTFLVIFYDEDGTTMLDWSLVPYGVTPTYNGPAPTKAENSQYTYTFDGWTLAPVTGETNYAATYTPNLRQYRIAWLDYKGELLFEENVDFGVMPTFKGDPNPPEKDQDDVYTYKFDKWEDSSHNPVATVSSAATYTSVFEREKRKYAITWNNYDDTFIKTDMLEYGEKPEYTGAEPTRDPDAVYTYEFAGWLPDIATVTGIATYTATYTSIRKQFRVEWLNWDGSLFDYEDVNYGEDATEPDPPPVKPGEWYFDKWDKDWHNITEDTTLTPQFLPYGPATDITITLNGVKIIAVVTGSRNSTYVFEITVGVHETTANIVWTSSDTSIATINATTGVVTTKTKLGSTTITARDTISGASYSFVLRAM